MISKQDAMIELLRRKAGTDLLAFLMYCWWMPSPLRIGRHTREICAALTKAVDDYLEYGKTTYLLINVPFRHGKSDIVSRALPAFFLGRCAAKEPNVIMSGYGASLIEGFSTKAREIVESEAYQRVFPNIRIGKSSAAEWSVDKSQSSTYAIGLGGSITGKGANLIIVDDYCKNREEAESQSIRDKMWNSFKDDLGTRLNQGGGVVVVCATRWHEDDISGRIIKQMAKDPDYPRYRELVFPAHKDGEDGYETLFPELYDEEWYRKQRSQLGLYSSAALLDCDPRQAGERFFRPEWLQTYIGELKCVSQLKINIFIDGAKGKAKKNDWTTMMVIGRHRDGSYYLLDGVHEKLNLYEKLEKLRELVDKWGGPRRVKVTWWEQVGPMSDVESLRMWQSREMYHFCVRELHHNTNKDFRIKKLAVPFSAGEIRFPTAIVRTRMERVAPGQPDRPVAYDFVAEFRDEFDKYTGNCEDLEHDDIIDCLADICDDEVIKSFTPPEGGQTGGFTDEISTWNAGKRFR